MPRLKSNTLGDATAVQVIRMTEAPTVSIGTSEQATQDGRSVKRTLVTLVTPRTPERPTRSLDPPEEHDLTVHSTDINPVHHHILTAESGRSKRSRRNNYFVSDEHDSFLTEWLGERDAFLAEIMRLEGLRGSQKACVRCAAADEVYRCKTCFGGHLLCAACCLKAHATLPFHVIEQWNGLCFVRTSLAEMGFTLQLGHVPGEPCRKPTSASSDFMVLHTNGWHKVKLQYCQCDRAAASVAEQLLRSELYPATLEVPATCFTFRLLELYHALTLQSKTTVYDFYITLNNLTDNTGVDVTWDRLKQLLRVVREWRHLKALKRAGRAYDPAGAAGTKKGELCIQCPACPRPEVNLPRDWQTVSDDKKFLYTLIVAVDANFRLKRRAVSNNERDPALGSGWGYFVEDKAYLEHVLAHANQEDISTCTGFAAISQANTRFSKGYASTGVGMVVCARHGIIRANGVGDLQKGERYCNMDYIVCSTLKQERFIIRLVISYDIACQWALRFLQRIMRFPEHLQVTLPDGPGELRYAIPKYHFRAHKEEGHTQYSLHYMKGVGRVCGEQIERTWPKHSETAGSTREMGPGSRHDTLEDHFGYTNWRVVVALGASLHRQHKRALTEEREHGAILAEFRGRLDPENVRAWEAEVHAYEQNQQSVADPYVRVVEGMTEAEVRLELANEDNADHAEGRISLHEVTPAGMIVEMLEIEELQRKFTQKYVEKGRAGTTLTVRQSTEMVSKRTAMRRRMLAIRSVQAIYMPAVPACVAAYINRSAPLADVPSAPRPTAAASDNLRLPDRPELEPLFFPSQLSNDQLVTATVGIKKIEERLRDAQLHDSLDKLRVQLHVKARLHTFKTRNVRNQGPNTRARKLLDTNDEKIETIARRYRAARVAKLALAGAGTWEAEWCPLQPSDVRTMLAEDDRATQDSNARGEGAAPSGSSQAKRPSWIWMAADRQSVDGDVERGIQDAVRIEYLKARARAQRCEEQVALLVEEKRRVLQTLEHEAHEWDLRRVAEHAAQNEPVAQGRAAYAAQQAMLRRNLASSFASLWGCESCEITEVPVLQIQQGAAAVPEQDTTDDYIVLTSDEEENDSEGSDVDD